MAANLVTTRLRARLRRSSLASAGITGSYQHARAFQVEDRLGPVGTSRGGNGSQAYSSHAVTGSVKFSSGGLGSILRSSIALFRCPNFNLSNASVNGIGGIPAGHHMVRHQHTDEWLVQRALADKRRKQARQKASSVRRVDDGDNQSQKDSLLPESSMEEKIVGVLGRPDLIVTRNVEWANLAFGFEQQNKYVIMDPREPQAPVGYILEDSNVIMRQFLRRRRPFVAHVLDAYGNEICLVRRPIWLINSTIYVEVDGKVIGEAHRRWHLWKRVYDCYLGEKQFAAVDNPGFWYWTFTLNDMNQGVLAVIDRNWRGFGFEFLTDAGQYVVRFGDSVPNYVPSPLQRQPLLEDVRVSNRPILTGSPTAKNEIQNLQTAAEEAEGLVVSRPLSLSERAVVLALAVSLDNDYFSHHSSGVGFIPLPFFGGSEVGDNVSPAENDIPQTSKAPEESLAYGSSKESWAEDGSLPGTGSDASEESWAEDGMLEGDDDVVADPLDVGTDGW